jgi:hypothetical protein
MELIASESSALLDLSIQQESIHVYFQPSEAACIQQPWIFANPAIEEPLPSRKSWKDTSPPLHLCESIA